MDAVDRLSTPTAGATGPRSSRRLPDNIVWDIATVAAMVEIYCRDKHQADRDLCPDCAALLAYALLRLEKCPYGADKTTCRVCPTHCYRPAQRALMAGVMRYAGPRMLWRHPWLALRHLWIERRGAPRRKPANRLK